MTDNEICPWCHGACMVPAGDSAELTALRADSERLEHLEKLHRDHPYGNGVILRISTRGKGFRLHATRGGEWRDPRPPSKTVREAITADLDAARKEGGSDAKKR